MRWPGRTTGNSSDGTATPDAGRPWPLRHRLWSLLALLALAIVVLILVWDWNWFRGPIERQVQARTGREFHIRGDLDVDLGWTPRISAESVSFGNAAWSRQPVMADARRAELDIALRPLLHGQVLLPQITLDQPRLLLETNPRGGEGNWVFGKPGQTDMQFRRVSIGQGQLRFLDRRKRTDIRIGVSSYALPDNAQAAPVAVVGGGQWRGSAFRLRGNAASPLLLRDRDAPYQIDVRASAGATHAHARGTLLDPLRLTGFNLRMALSGRDMADLYPLLGLAIPTTPPYSLDGRFSREGNTWHYRGFTGRIGDSDMHGDASVETGRARPYLRADLRSQRLDFDDLAGFVGGTPQAGRGETANPEQAAKAASREVSARLIPDKPYELEKLRAMDADVRLRATHINAPRLPLDDMDAHLLLEGGLLRLQPLNFGVADGEIRSTIRMDARTSTITTRADIDAAGLNLAKLMPEVKLAQNAIGKIGGKVNITGAGNSVARMLGSSDGSVLLGMGRGKISNLLMEMAGIDLAEMIKFKLSGDRLIPVRCGFADFAVDDGVMTARSFAFDTTDTILLGSGTINLGKETLDLTIRPRPKDRSLLAFRTPLKVDGRFRQPRVHPDLVKVGLRGAIALTLATITPPAALLATLETGPGEDSGCGGRYAK
ncbi:AsmA family protein [Lysobacter sp. S4-A87]|uniref:AsmA family protein n=1 Tax=Lysobacter sp. S4-A87 TaxID=2925843 RepID=UPI001F531836|nr:AsmA family protein [Lysobacter sp. S4-A87]UNK50780.1 AsmA family protein [Lysobacter sp. S4-A87]